MNNKPDTEDNKQKLQSIITDPAILAGVKELKSWTNTQEVTKKQAEKATEQFLTTT